MSPAAFDLQQLAEAARTEKVRWQYHAQLRLIERLYDPDEVLAAIVAGEVIEDYADQRPHPTALLLGQVGKRLVHVVVGLDPSTGWAYIVTLYEPSAERFDAAGRKRRSP